MQFAEHIQNKINTDPTCDAKKVFMSKYDAAEQMLIEKGSDVRGKHFDVW